MDSTNQKYSGEKIPKGSKNYFEFVTLATIYIAFTLYLQLLMGHFHYIKYHR